MKWLLALSILVLGPVCQANFSAADISYDLSQGFIEVNPLLHQQTWAGIAASREVSYGLFTPIKWLAKKTKETVISKKRLEDVYFIFEGNPSKFSIYIISFVCSGRSLEKLLGTYNDFQSLQGEFSASGTWLSSRSVIANALHNANSWILPYLSGYQDFLNRKIPKGDYPAYKPEDYVNEACTDKFRNHLAAYRLETIAPTIMDGFIKQTWDGKNLTLTWNPDEWVHPIITETRQFLEEMGEFINEHEKMLEKNRQQRQELLDQIQKFERESSP